MAGDWIKFEHATLDKPEVLKMAETLSIDPDEVVGKLLRVWIWFDQQSTNGDAGGVTSVTLMKFIDRHVGRQGFAACMKLVGWLDESGAPNFERHNGESSKNRALTNKRMKKMRNATVTPIPSPEKRREELKTNTPALVPRAPRPRDTPLPTDFAVSERVRRWAGEKGYGPLLALHFEAFVSTCRAKGYQYADWDEAFMNAIRKNWAGLKASEAPGRLAI